MCGNRCAVRQVIYASVLLLMAAPVRAQFPRPAAQNEPGVQLRQLEQVKQGANASFEVSIEPRDKRAPLTLRIRREVGTGEAAFEDGSREKSVDRSQKVRVVGLVASDIPGGLTLTAWRADESEPAATAYFDVIAGKPEPRIYFGGRDITGATEQVIAGQEVQLDVILHPSLKIRSEQWTIGEVGQYVGGFLHTPLRGGPQPVVTRGSTTKFYWIASGSGFKVTYTLVLDDGEAANAEATFDVSGPSNAEIATEWEKLVVGPGILSGTSYMGFAGPGVAFRGRYELEPELRKNFTWVQLIREDRVLTKTDEGTMECMPKTQPQAEAGTGLDTNYPYDTRNPTHDSPPIQLTDEADEVSRELRAEMYLLWNSGRSNSIAVPLAALGWKVSGHAVRTGHKWKLIEGAVAADEGKLGAGRSYPQWSNLVPYSGVVTCHEL